MKASHGTIYFSSKKNFNLHHILQPPVQQGRMTLRFNSDCKSHCLMFEEIHSASSSVLISPDATRMIIGTISLGSSRVHVLPLIVMNIHVVAWAVRLLPSGTDGS